jgi:hypothetical protein
LIGTKYCSENRNGRDRKGVQSGKRDTIKRDLKGIARKSVNCSQINYERFQQMKVLNVLHLKVSRQCTQVLLLEVPLKMGWEVMSRVAIIAY